MQFYIRQNAKVDDTVNGCCRFKCEGHLVVWRQFIVAGTFFTVGDNQFFVMLTLWCSDNRFIGGWDWNAQSTSRQTYIATFWSCLARPEKLIGNEYRVECDCQLGKCFSEATCMDIRTYSRRSSALPIRNTRVPVCLSHLVFKWGTSSESSARDIREFLVVLCTVLRYNEIYYI